MHDALGALRWLQTIFAIVSKLRSPQEMHVVRRREHVPMLSMLRDGQVSRGFGVRMLTRFYHGKYSELFIQTSLFLQSFPPPPKKNMIRYFSMLDMWDLLIPLWELIYIYTYIEVFYLRCNIISNASNSRQALAARYLSDSIGPSFARQLMNQVQQNEKWRCIGYLGDWIPCWVVGIFLSKLFSGDVYWGRFSEAPGKKSTTISPQKSTPLSTRLSTLELSMVLFTAWGKQKNKSPSLPPEN